MNPLVSRLAHLMVQRKRTGAEPYVLLLGAGTSPPPPRLKKALPPVPPNSPT